MQGKRCFALPLLLLVVALSPSNGEAQKAPGRKSGAQQLEGHLIGEGRTVGKLNESIRLHLAIGLPIRNPSLLDRLQQELYNPKSARYHQYLAPRQFGETLGATEADYSALLDFAKSKKLTVTATYPSRILLDVSGTVADIQKAFYITLSRYKRRDGSTYFAPDRQPSLDLSVKVLHISGLDSFRVPKPAFLGRPAPLVNTPAAVPLAGSGPSGTFVARDFRDVYLPGITLDGSGQTVALVEFDGFLQSDILAYEALFPSPHPNVTVQPIPIDGFSTLPDSNFQGSFSYQSEVTLDIDMAIAMAPGLSKVAVYEAPNTAIDSDNADIAAYNAAANDVLNQIATDNSAKQISCSWGLFGDSNTVQVLQQFVMQGQAFFISAGDVGAFAPGEVTPPQSLSTDMTIVGGTMLSTTGTSGMVGSYLSETTWNDPTGQFCNGGGGAGGGGIDTGLLIPLYQAGLATTLNSGSAQFRNLPDVSMVADNLLLILNGQQNTVCGTSAATPLWAGFLALANQQAASRGDNAIGFFNPKLYEIAEGPNYNTDFHDIRDGSNNSSVNFGGSASFTAVAGYDLATGWGTPTPHLLEDLAPPCGAVSEICCAKGAPCGANLVCENLGGGQNQCTCGFRDQPCCQPGDGCSPGLQCDVDRRCSCGGTNEVCCNQSPQCNPGLVCSVSMGYKCITTCGHKGQPCCPGSSCIGPLVCRNGACSCGGLNEFCCAPGGTCDFGLSCANGVCSKAGSSCPQCKLEYTNCLADCGPHPTAQCQCNCSNVQCSCFQARACGPCVLQNCGSPSGPGLANQPLTSANQPRAQEKR